MFDYYATPTNSYAYPNNSAVLSDDASNEFEVEEVAVMGPTRPYSGFIGHAAIGHTALAICALSLPNLGIATSVVEPSQIAFQFHTSKLFVTTASNRNELSFIFNQINPSDISQFLSDHPMLSATLNELSDFLMKEYAVTGVSLEYFMDEYSEIETLLVTPNFSSEEIDDLMAFESEILETFFYPRRSAIADMLVLSV